MNVKLFLTLILLGIGVLFVLQNATVVEIRFLIWSFEISGALLYFILLSVGIMAGWLLNSFSRMRRERDRNKRIPSGMNMDNDRNTDS